MGDINVARTCDYLSAKVEAAYQRNGFLVRLRGSSRIVCTNFRRKDQHDNQIKSKQLSPPIFVSQFYRHKNRLSFFRLQKTHKFTHSLLPFKILPCHTILAATKANKKCRKRSLYKPTIVRFLFCPPHPSE